MASFRCAVYKNGKDGGSVFSMCNEKRKSLVIISRRVLKYKPSFHIEQLFFRDAYRKVINIFERIRRAGKNEIKLFIALLNKTKYIHPDGFHLWQLKAG